MNQIRRILFGVVCWAGLMLGAADMYVAPTALGTGDGYSSENAAAWTDKIFWAHVQLQVKKQDITVHFTAGNYMVSRQGTTSVYLSLRDIGADDHTLTMLGAENGGTILMRDPAEPTDQTEENRVEYIILLYRCRNIVIDNLHFRGNGAIGEAVNLQTMSNVLVRNCSWVDMRGLFYGALGSGHTVDGTRITIENCIFDNIGYNAYAHCLYNTNDATDVLVRNCIFRDCAGEYVRFRHSSHRGTVENCLFESTGKIKKGVAFISIPLFNDEDPAIKTDPSAHEYFSRNLTFRNNTFIGLNRSTDSDQYMLSFLNSGYNPIGKQYLISKTEAAALGTMPVSEARAWMRDRLDIDFDDLQWVNNTGRGVAGVCRYWSQPHFGSEEEFPPEEYDLTVDVTHLLRIQQGRSARLPEETRAVWMWGDSLTDDAAATAAKLKIAGVNTVYLMAKNAYGKTPWNSAVSLVPETDDPLAGQIQTFHDYGIAVHLWIIYHSDTAWTAAHPEDRPWHFGMGGEPAILKTGNAVCPISGYRSYVLSLIREIVSQPTKYPIDGIHLVPRYTHAMYCFCPTHTAKAKTLGINVDNVRAAMLAGFGADGTGNGEAYYGRFRAGDPDVTRWVRMRETEMKELGEAVAAILAETQPGLVFSLSAAIESAEADDTVGRCQFALNLAAQGNIYDLVCPLGNHTTAGQPASWCTDLAVRAAVRSGVPALTGMGGSDDAAAVIADSRTRGGSTGYGVFRYETMAGEVFRALGAATGDGYAGDLDNNGRADVMLVNADGNAGAWLTFAGDMLSWLPLSTLSEGFTILDYGHSARGKRTPDIYIYNALTGVVGAWTTDPLGVTGWLTFDIYDPSTTVIGLGDFNGDGISDLLLRSASGDIGCDLGGLDEAITGWHYLQTIGPEWTIQAIGDLNGDNIDDIVLMHDTGCTGAWLIRNGSVAAWRDLGDLNGTGQIVGCGDFDGDGTEDILIRVGAACGAWMIRDGSVAAWRDLGTFSGTVEDIIDIDNDGVSDLRVRTDSGDIGCFLVPRTGDEPLVWHYFGTVGAEWITSHSGL